MSEGKFREEDVVRFDYLEGIVKKLTMKGMWITFNKNFITGKKITDTCHWNYDGPYFNQLILFSRKNPDTGIVCKKPNFTY